MHSPPKSNNGNVGVEFAVRKLFKTLVKYVKNHLPSCNNILIYGTTKLIKGTQNITFALLTSSDVEVTFGSFRLAPFYLSTIQNLSSAFDHYPGCDG
jgi:hypothetical protein